MKKNTLGVRKCEVRSGESAGAVGRWVLELHLLELEQVMAL